MLKKAYHVVKTSWFKPAAILLLYMAIKYQHNGSYSMYFCTFTCYNWMHLFQLTDGYDTVYNCFSVLKEDSINTVGYVIMPNHVHCILHFNDLGFSLIPY